MSDPVAVKNAKRQLALHRIGDAKYNPPAAIITCLCGWRREWDRYNEGEIELAWSTHKREVGEPA